MAYLGGIKSLQRYNFAFKKFWAFCKAKNLCLNTSNLSEVAAHLQQMNAYFPSECKNVYAALLKIPGLDQLRFHPLLQNCKKSWNKSVPKYATFWSPEPIIKKLLLEKLDWNNILQIRERLIISLRFFMLYRNIDLQRCFRTVHLMDGRPFILVQRKNWRTPQLEELVRIPEQPAICPWALMTRYVSLTSNKSTGSHLFCLLQPPFTPLTANTLGSLTKRCLTRLGLNMTFWGAHSTRGAAVGMYKRLNFASEEVCELGKWKNTQAFQAHYLRLGVAQQVKHRLGDLVHTASPGYWAEPDLTCTLGSLGDPGGSVREGEAQETGEPNPPTTKKRKEKVKRKISLTPLEPLERPLKFKFATRTPQTGELSVSSSPSDPPIAGPSALTHTRTETQTHAPGE